MPKFATPYDTLLRVRRIEEDKAKAELAAANLARREADATLEGRREHYRSTVALPNGETDVAGFRGRLAHSEAAAAGVQHAHREVEKAEDARAQAAEATRLASMRTQGLERLVDRAKEALVQEMLAADQRTAEESMAGKRPKGAR